MVLSHGTAHSEAAKMEQIITEFFAKSLHIILESRALCVSSRDSYADQAVLSPCSSSSSSPSVRPRDKWFNLGLRECPAALESADLWRRSSESIVIDVILVERPHDWDQVSFSPKRVIQRSSSLKERYPFSWNTDHEELGFEPKSEKIVERWVVQYESKNTKDSNSGNRRSSNISLHTLYKKSTLLLRSLYATVRLLPAYKVFRELNSSAQIRAFTLAHRVSSFVEPFTRREEAEMLKFGFTPVDTSSGRLCLWVMYRPSASYVSLEPSTQMTPQVINDYVGSPLADPLRRFPSLPVRGCPSHGFPSALPFSRRHSWSYDHGRASPTSINYLPSPTHSRCTSKNDRTVNAMRATAEKLFSIGKDEPRRYSGVKISANNSPQISISRNSSRSYQDDFDDTDFTCPFDVDDDDMTDPGSRKWHNCYIIRIRRTTMQLEGFLVQASLRPESLDHSHMPEALEAGGFLPIKKSHDAAVGALVHMLKKAQPLQQDFSTSEHSSKSTHPETCNNTQDPNQILEAPLLVSMMSSALTTNRKTTTDALEEFRGYREMKNLLLIKGNKPQI